MNFNCIIKAGLVAVAAMVSLSSFSQDLIARQAPIDKKLKTVDSLALQKQIRIEQSEYPALSLYPTWNNRSCHHRVLHPLKEGFTAQVGIMFT
jgi:hypothetical protein